MLCTCSPTCVYACVHTCVHTCSPTCVHGIHVYLHVYLHVYIYIHALLHVYLHVYKHVCNSHDHFSQGTKAIMKDVARFLPGIGWTFLFMEYPLLKRNWAQDEDALIESCRNLRDYPVNMLVSYTYMYILHCVYYICAHILYYCGNNNIILYTLSHPLKFANQFIHCSYIVHTLLLHTFYLPPLSSFHPFPPLFIIALSVCRGYTFHRREAQTEYGFC